MQTYIIYPMVVGSKVFDKGMMIYQHDYGMEYTIPIYSWYIQGTDKQILMDTGEMQPIQSESRKKAIDGRIVTLEQELARFGLEPGDIDVVIHTHLHNDHCENDYKCANARFYCHNQEPQNVHNPHPLDYKYLEDFIEDIEENGQIEEVQDGQEILPGISVLHPPAQTPGGLTVMVQTEKGLAAITGFCVREENLFPPAQITAM